MTNVELQDYLAQFQKDLVVWIETSEGWEKLTEDHIGRSWGVRTTDSRGVAHRSLNFYSQKGETP